MRFLVCLLALLALAGPADAAVAFDAFNTGATGTGNLSWTHTPSGTPRGAIVVCRQAGENANVDEISGVTWGGTAMTELATHSPIIHSSGTLDADGAVYTYFLGASIPSGAQTVAVTVTGSFTKHCNSISLTAAADTEIVDAKSIDQQLPSGNVVTVGTLALSGRTAFAMLNFLHGGGSTGGVTPSTNWTSRVENDYGPAIGGAYTYDVIGTTDVVADYAETVGGINSAAAIAIAEVVVGGGTSRGLMLMGVGG